MLRLRSLRPFLPVFISYLVLACASDSGGGDLDDGNGGNGGQGGAIGTTGTSKTQKLGVDGGKVTTDSVTLTFPAGAVRKQIDVTVASLSADDAKTLPATSGGIKPAGIPVKFTPHGLTFDEPVDVTLDYTPPDDEDTPLVAMKLDNDTDPTWEVVPDAKFESGESNFQINSFSYYCVFSDPNGVAEELYGPDDQGSGGGSGSGGSSSGSGGDGTGGEGTGGEGSGGEAGGGTSGGGSAGSAGGGGTGSTGGGGTGSTGGVGGLPSGGVGGDGGTAGGGTGGTGGTGGSGGSSASAGYLRTPTIHGYGIVGYSGTGTVLNTDLSTNAFPNCVWGSTTSAADSFAYLGYNINQNEFPVSSPNPPVLMDHDGLWVSIGWNASPRPMRIELVDQPAGKLWCAPLPASGGLEFLGWEYFNDNCLTGEGTSFDPETDTANKVIVRALPTLVDQEFDFCINDLSTGGPVWAPPGYLNGPDWFGHGSLISDPSVTFFSDDLDTKLAPNCASGMTGDLDGYAGIQYNVDQPQAGIPLAIELGGAGVKVGVNWDGTRPQYVQLTSLELGMTFCAPIPGPGVHFIAYSNFDTSCTGEGSPFPFDALVDSVSVVVLGTEFPGAGFDFCITDLGPDTGPVGPPPGYLNGQYWFGDGLHFVDGISEVFSDLDVNVFPNCFNGTTDASPGAFAGVHYNVNQPVGGSNSPIFLQGDGVHVNLFDWDGVRPLYAQIRSLTEGAAWCAPIPGPGPQLIPLEAFNTECIGGTGLPLPGELLIDSVGVVALSTGILSDPFNFCVADLRPEVPLNGYLTNPAWHGYGFMELNGDATVDFSSLDSGPAPHCAEGTTGLDVNSGAAMVFAVNQANPGGENPPVTITHAGMWVDFQASVTERTYMVRAHDSTLGRNYCATLPGSMKTFVPWENFSDNCADPPAGVAPIPGVDQIDYVALHVPSTGIASDPYGFCVFNLEPLAGEPIPNGYLNGPDWTGYGAAFSGGVVEMFDNIGSAPAPNCIWGTMSAAPGGFASLSYRVQESTLGNDNVPINLEEDGITIGINTTEDSDLRVEVFSGEESTTYCAPLPPGSGTFNILWSDFNDTCWTTGGNVFNPGSTLIDEIGISVISEAIDNDLFDVCIISMEEYVNP